MMCLLLWLGCGTEAEAPTDAERGPVIDPQVERDLADIKADGVLRAITTYSSTSYFLYRGQPMGFEYELLQRFAETQGLELEILIAEDIDDLFDMLNRGEGDLVAHGMTITTPRRAVVAFTKPHFTTYQALVQRKPDNWQAMKVHNIKKQLVSDPLDLIGKTVHVRRQSSYYQRLQNLQEELGGEIDIDTVSGKLSTSDIIRLVAEGELDYTVADHNIAAINQAYYRNLDVDTRVSTQQRIAWAVRRNSPELKQMLDRWIEAEKRSAEYHVIYNKYFKNHRSFRRIAESDFFSKNSDRISHYDSLIQTYSQEMGWDWRLVSSLVYQESRFDPGEQSWAGARGLMQLMPATARELGVNNPLNPTENLRGGTRYLDQLYERWVGIPDSVQRIKFAMASYNCGYGHVLDAQRLAEKYDKDPLVWDDNVETYLLRLSDRHYFTDEVVRYGYARGHEPYHYVQDIFTRYDHYQKFIGA